MVCWLNLVLLIHFLSHLSEARLVKAFRRKGHHDHVNNTVAAKRYDDTRSVNEFVMDHSTYKSHNPGCSYKGYHPGYQPTLTKMKHINAQLQVDAISNVFISEGFTIARGTAGATEEFLDTTGNLAKKTAKLAERNKKAILNVMTTGFKFASKFAPVLGPALGIFAEVFGAVAGVKTPTHEDILGATNKALDKLTAEVDLKLEEMRQYVDEKIITLEKEIIQRKYTFLFMYWSECVKLETKDEVDLCQREAFRLIVASKDSFLLFHNRLDEREAKFRDGSLTDEEMRRIEVGMISFRNYALLALLCVKTVAKTYDEMRQLSNERIISCGEFRQEVLDHMEELEWKTDKPKTKWYCLYEEELVKNSRYFERYGKAAVEAIKTVAKNRLKDPPSYEPDTTKEFKEETFFNFLKPPGKYKERRISCAAKLHPSKKDVKCQYDVSMIEYVSEEGKENSYLIHPPRSNYRNIENEEDMETWRDDGISGNTPTGKWCHTRIQARRKDYLAMEQRDISVYWAGEVMRVVTCGRLLAEGTIEDCEDKTMYGKHSKALEQVILLKNLQAKSVYGELAKNAVSRSVDGLLKTRSATKIQRDPWWSAELVEPAKITEIHIYMHGYAKRKRYYDDLIFETGVFQGDTEEDEDGNPAKKKWTPCTQLRNPTYPQDLRTPLIVKCDRDNGLVQLLKISRPGRTILYLAEVKVYGHVPPQEEDSQDGSPITAISKSAVVELRDATQNPDSEKKSDSASNAIDGLASTMSRTKFTPNWAAWTAKLETRSKILSVNIQLYGKYKSVKVKTGVNGKDDWKDCGAEQKDVDGDDVEGIRFECEGDKNKSYVRILAQSAEEKGLMIRNVEVISADL